MPVRIPDEDNHLYAASFRDMTSNSQKGCRYPCKSGDTNFAERFPLFFQIFVDKSGAVQYTVKALRKQFEAWLSLVERSVRDAEAASSNLVASIRSEKSMQQARPIGQAVKTEPSHGSNPGSIPGSVISSVSSEKKYIILSRRGSVW